MNPNLETALVFAARYAHHRKTGAALTVVNLLKDSWSDISSETRMDIINESYEATANLDDWESLRDFAAQYQSGKI